MCGIFGAVCSDCVQKTLSALHFLEYRGYDSAGICVGGDGLTVIKTEGRVSALEQMLPQNLCGVRAMGHTRWATHGKVCNANAHPFLSQDGNFCICHNGILENYRQLQQLLPQVKFSSQTDSETIAHLLQHNYNGNMVQTLLKTASMLQGSYAVLVQTALDNKMYAIKNKSPLVVGVAPQQAFLCSDVRCLAQWAKRAAIVPDNTIVVADSNGICAFDENGKEVQLKFFAPDGFCLQTQQEGSMMLSEIFHIPQCLAQAKSHYFQSGGLNLPANLLRKLKRIYFLGCGTACNSGMQACAVARNFCRLDMQPVVASEFVYDNFPTDEATLAFCISQSGETADTLRAAEKVKQQGGIAYAVTNTTTSTLCHICHKTKNVCAGGEFAVASTKAYNCQLQTLLLMLMDIACARGELSPAKRTALWQQLDSVPAAVDQVLAQKEKLRQIALRLKDSSAVFFLGRTTDYPTAVEGSLKLKEISYIHSEAYPSGELKHGTLALMEQGVTAVLVSTSPQLANKNASTANEITSRNANVVTISPYKGTECHFTLPVVHQYFYGLVSVVPLQLLAYFAADALGRDVDKPRNLAKSVTVE